uniref:Bm28 n=1 Tax=Brugia malayi TaxID=6279 RepID=A0A1P6BVK9_BRUMA|nr:Bm28 [Brugia malayi]CDQ01542.1 Bm889 [Brugia malayi]
METDRVNKTYRYSTNQFSNHNSFHYSLIIFFFLLMNKMILMLN